MKDVLLPIGTLVEAEIGDEIKRLLIIGKRQVKKYKNNFDDGYTYRAWDYKAVLFPEGLTDDDFYYFNHMDITHTVRIMEVTDDYKQCRAEED
jgi:hypothetical protein